jgi:tripartite ATP-independent transporter DctP family solute receptor
MKLNRRLFLGTTAAALATPMVLRAQATVLRWGEMLPTTHPQVMMADRIAADVKEKSGGRIDIQTFPNGQLGSGKDMMDSVVAGALTMTTDGAAALGALLPQLSVLEAPYLWQDAAQMSRAYGAPVFNQMNEDFVAQRGIRIVALTYYGQRHVTSGSKEIHSAADMVGFKLRVPPVDTFRAMAEAWGAQATPISFNELYLALSQGAVDGQENPLPTIASAKLNEVQKFLILTGHIITPRLVVVNEAAWAALPAEDRTLLEASIAEAVTWQDAELLSQEATLIDTLKGAGMTVIEPDVASFREPVLATVPAMFADKWGADTWDALAAL